MRLRTHISDNVGLFVKRVVLLVILFCFFSVKIIAQGPFILFVDGTVKEGKVKLVGATVTVYEDGNKTGSVIVNATGKFGFDLLMDHQYIIEFSKAGYVSKKISVNTKGVPPEDAEFGFEFGGWQVLLFKKVEGLDVSILDNPVGKIFYDPEDGGFNYDVKYTKSIRNEMDKLQSDLANKLAAAAAAEQNYKHAITAGDKAFGSSHYSSAVEHYNKALEVKPGDTYATSKLAEVETKAAGEKAAADATAAKDLEFSNLVTEADTKFKNKDYDGAKAAYTAAIGVKPNEKYPKDQIKKINDLIANAAEEERLAKAAEEKRLADEKAAEEAKLAAEKEEKRLAEEAPAQKAEEEKLAKEAADAAVKAEEERLTKEAEEKRLAEEAAQAEKDRLAQESADAEAKQAEEERLAQEAADAAAKAEEERLDQEAANAAAKAEEERLAKEAANAAKAEEERLAQESADTAAKAEEEKLAQESADAAAKNAEEERLAKEAEDNRLAEEAAQTERDRLAQEAAAKSEEERLAQEAANAARLAEIEADKEDVRKRKSEEDIALDAEHQARLDKITSEQHTLSEYRAVIEKADLHFNFKKYEAAITEYENALAMRPDQVHPRERIDQIHKILGIEANKAKMGTATTQDYHLPKDDFRNAIAEKYPEGITEELEVLGNKTITKRYVVKGNHGDEYKMIKHSWGGKFFFKNDQQITELLWTKETEP
ncbi:MAG: hypothetical protein JKY53_07020 [Flavobacteriales bacterium]|nr:hypothetical protein [Flavobacteriales bacterium]